MSTFGQDEMDALLVRVEQLEDTVKELQEFLKVGQQTSLGALQTPERTPQTATPKKTYNSTLIRSIRTEFVDGPVSSRTPISKTSTSSPNSVGQEYKNIVPVATEDIPLGAGREVVIGGGKKKDVKEIKEPSRPPRAAKTAAVVPVKEEARVEVKRGGFTISLPQSTAPPTPTSAPAPLEASLLPLPLTELPETQLPVGASGGEFKHFWQNSDLSFPLAELSSELSSFPPPPQQPQPQQQQQSSGWGLFATSSPTNAGGSNIPSPAESLLATLLKGGSACLLDDEAASGKKEDHMAEFL